MSDKQTRMLEYLSQTPVWVTAGELADHLGVTPRTVRSYVTNVKAAAHPLDVIESGTAGYRLDLEAYAAFRSSHKPADPDSKQNRLYALVRRLTESDNGLDVYSLAAELFVSDSTIEADLARVRSLLPETGLTLGRRGSVVTLAGSETDRRRLLSRMFREETDRGMLNLETIQREFASKSLSAFKTDLIAMLDAQGYFVNEYGTNDVLLHVAIAVDRVTKRAAPLPAEPQATPPDEMTQALAVLIKRHFDVELAIGDLDYIGLLLTTRVITPGHDQPATKLIENFVRPEDLDTVRQIVTRASEEFLVDLTEETFIVRLTLHVRNLINRAQDRSFAHNPLTRSIKTSYPMIYELAVYIASQLQRQERIVINDDEIAYIAMHVGAHLQQQSRRVDLVSCAIVCPNYYDMHVLLRERIERVLGDELEVVSVVTRSDVDWNGLEADLVLTTIDPGRIGDGIIVIQPFLTETDIERIRKAASRVRRLRRRAHLKDDLLQFFDASLFSHNFYASDEDAMIRALGERMAEQGIIEPEYIDGAIERELMSSTAFTDNLAVPHSMSMTANRTSIAIVINDTPMDWGEARVNVVALVAFSAAGRKSFQDVFDQFVEVFSDRNDVQRLVRRSVDFASFIDELVHLMDQ
ncbi:transcription antiterminator [Cryobacterium algoricola]|uniref:BglG family transcription antiterminator n=2 Tax=Cryobacterium TaxID=69578 RepID=A0AA41UDN3_9MICO|nr:MULTISPECIES: BglG family transcription antiterminator [Cryobacterium]MCI4656498.1 BglG family transcription antiterminator [Cryobacterium zhongshanensis]TFB87060.1 transcription antiterminator [Cryobacterium algoricola]